MAQRSRGRPPKVSLFDQNPEGPEFFEIFLPDQNSQQLRIPPAFVKHFEGTIPEKIILKDLGGEIWHVDLKEEEKGLYFKNGWQRFVNDNSLELGEFVLLRYNRSSAASAFSVRIFGKNGCKKGKTIFTENRVTSVKNEIESKSDLSTIHKRKYSEVSPKRPEMSTGSRGVSLLTPRNGTKRVKRHKNF